MILAKDHSILPTRTIFEAILQQQRQLAMLMELEMQLKNLARLQALEDQLEPEKPFVLEKGDMIEIVFLHNEVL